MATEHHSDTARRRLAGAFKDQARFAAGYAPAAARVFAVVGDWLARTDESDVGEWLVQEAAGLQPFAVTNLLLAGLHRDALACAPAARPLRSFFPTCGGEATRPGIEEALHALLASRSESLGAFIRRGRVQTNETARGLCWLLPLMLTGWQAAHLVDLGASAGLNLMADKRHYELRAEDDDRVVCALGDGDAGQFVTLTTGSLAELCRQLSPLPRLITRLGGDARPFGLMTATDELELEAFVWPDHPERLERLRQGIVALRAYSGPFQLEKVDLPAGVDPFLAQHVPATGDPVVLYNTYLTPYLPDKGTSLRANIASWAARQPAPVLWLQWEPPASANLAPHEGWCAWTVQIWRQGKTKAWQIGWVHPHGTHAIINPDFPGSAWFDTIS